MIIENTKELKSLVFFLAQGNKVGK